ncbi:hypothetical protein [Cryobacterium sp. GrIS_2_6]|uniref:hypothetical protein n=1 Tax=Cryobacterium sp. GrIS_2_6 TaxID=3162785 RepID=UPI002E0BC1E2|nr:hypothetical protein [Cryobacterium psychrotolerans]MEC5149226.1 hypothetical protein [Cryobacterium psychrotolerans]MEC5149306.1 hypothetical protein [Cryobacterium psychrotolerans]
MARYKFVHDFAEVFAHLVHGPDALVHRDGDDAEGSTVVLNPGDEITLTEPLEHAHLVPVEEPTKPTKAPKSTESKE